ncbi:PAS domain S-box protein [Flammeovirgaceae bacterium SG7u.111]|nr:PAS domain S-box protein [Flammeovirgaceae bacterium SG7u.132]WPO35816.1 PAS domain S-box protein [Flammeovirgaceae bacterium SG7u.111]
MQIKKLLNWFIPNIYLYDFRKSLMAGNIVAASLLLAATGLVYGTLCLLNGFFVGMWLSFFCSTTVLSALFVLKKWRNLLFSGIIVNLSLFIMIIGMGLMTGGTISPSYVWFAVIPVVAVLIHGRKVGMLWGAATLFVIALFFMADFTHLAIPNLLPYKIGSLNWKTMQMLSIFMFVFFILLIGFFADYIHSRTVATMFSVRETLRQKVKELHKTQEGLRTSEEELRQNTEELLAINDVLKAAQQELKLSLRAEKRSSEALKQSESEIRRLIDNMNEGLVAVDKNGKITFGNQSLCNMFRMSLTDILHKTPGDFLDEENQKIFFKEFSSKNTRDGQSYEIEWTRQDGSKFASIVAPQSMFGEEGLFTGSVAVITDITQQKQVEQELKIREQRLKGIFANAAVGIGLLSPEGEFILSNHALSVISGYSEASLMNMSWFDLFGEDKEKEIEIGVEWMHNKQKNFSHSEKKIYTKNGKQVWLSLSYTPLNDSEGTLESILIVLVDITERKLAEQALIDSEKKYRMLLDKANEAIVVSVDNKIRMHNPKLEEMTGYSSDELNGMDISELIHLEDWEQISMRNIALPECADDNRTYGVFRMISKNGEERWFGTVTNQIEWEGEMAYQDFIEDIHDRKIAEDQLKRYEVITSTASELMALINQEYVYTAVNKAYVQFIGTEEENIIGKTAEEIFGKDEFKHFYKEKMIRCFNGEVVAYRRWQEYQDRRMFIDVIYKPVFEEDGTVSNLVVVAKDVTKLKEAEDELYEKNKALNRSNDELKSTIEQIKAMQSQMINSEKMASLGQLTAGIAHEINNPVNFISGNISPLMRDLQELKEGFKLYADIKKSEDKPAALKNLDDYLEEIDAEFIFEEINALVGGIKEGAKRTKEIVMGLRNFSRLDEDDLKIADINEGIESTLTLLHNQVKHRIVIHKDYGEIPKIECYPGKLNQVFMNILNNAQQAIAGKGEISIKTTLENGHVIISIKDTGKGIGEHVKPKVFEPFFTTKEVGEGTGLGLSISYGIIQQHQGDIDFLSEEEQGTEFVIKLPIKQKERNNF